MLNLIFFPFRLCGWIGVQLYRLCGLLMVQPVRFLLAVFSVVSRRWMLGLMVLVYGGFALRVYTPYPVGEWYTTIIHYPDSSYVSPFSLMVDSLLYRETDAPDLRATQFRFVMYLLLVHALIVMTYNRYSRLRTSLASKAVRLREMRPPALWPVSKRAQEQEQPSMSLEPIYDDPDEQPVPDVPLVYARYGLVSRTPNEDLESAARRLSPDMQKFIGMQE